MIFLLVYPENSVDFCATNVKFMSRFDRGRLINGGAWYMDRFVLLYFVIFLFSFCWPNDCILFFCFASYVQLTTREPRITHSALLQKKKSTQRMLWPGSLPYTEADILAGERSRTDLFALVTVLHFALIEEIEKKGILCLFGPFSCFQSIEI